MPDVPFLSDFPRAVQIAARDPYGEIARYLATHRDKVANTFKTLTYFDGVNFAARAKALCPSECRKFFGRVAMSGPQVGIEVTGLGVALDNALDAIAPFGRIALLGCTRDSNFMIDYYHKVHGRGVTLIGAHTLARPNTESASGWWTTRDDAKAFLRLLSLGRLSLDGFVSEVHSPTACGEVYARLAKGGAFPVVQFDWTRLET